MAQTNANSDMKEEEQSDCDANNNIFIPKKGTLSSDETIDIDAILSTESWPNHITPKYKNFKAEVLSHNVIGEKNWIRVVMECEKAMKVIYFSAFRTSLVLYLWQCTNRRPSNHRTKPNRLWRSWALILQCII